MRDRPTGEVDAPAERSSRVQSALLQPEAGQSDAVSQVVEASPSEDEASSGQDVSGSSQDVSGSSQGESGPRRPMLNRYWAALLWLAGGAALFTLYLRIARSKGVNSDAANNALQAWDLLHGHLLLHGWVIGDATYYTFELPLIALVEVFFGEHTVTMNVTEALVYLIVTALAVAIAVTGSSGLARVTRAAVVVAVLAAPALVGSDMWIPLGIPDHTGTTIFLLLPALLLNRWAERWWTSPLICVLLTAGQIGDVTVRYVAVPAIAVACGYRILVNRRLRSWDTAGLLAALISLPLAVVVRSAMISAGSYLMVSPKTKAAPAIDWIGNLAPTWGALRELFGAQPGHTSPPAGTIVWFGYAALFIAVLGIVTVLWRRRTAQRADQVLVAAIAANLAVYIVSTLPSLTSPHDIVAVLPASAVLGARAVVPDRFTSRLTAWIAAGFALVAISMPLSIMAAQPYAPPVITPLANWLRAHGLHTGLGGYWDGSAVTLFTAGQVQVRPVHLVHVGYQVQLGHLVSTASKAGVALYEWETSELWFDPTQHYANFAVIRLGSADLLTPAAARAFGKPASTHIVGTWEVLIYHHNLLNDLVAPPPRSTS